MGDISANGTFIRIRASVTFPVGFTVTAFADDADPYDTPSIKVADVAMGLNGDLVKWSMPNAIMRTLNVIPNSDDDINLSILLEANRVGKGKQAAKDRITMITVYPDGETVTYTGGVITDGMPSKSAASSGRFKTNAYIFAFENLVRA